MSQTKNLKLNIHDDLSSEENFNSQTYLYDNWTKIDDYADTIEKKTSELDSTIAEQSSKISSLEADNETNKTNISDIQTKDTEQDAEITSIKEEQTTQNNNIQSNTTAINKNADDIETINTQISNLKTDTNVDISTVILTETVTKETDYELPLNYIVGNSSLKLFWNGTLLFEGDDGNFKEIGTADEQSNLVQFGWDLEIGDILTVEVRGVANEE